MITESTWLLLAALPGGASQNHSLLERHQVSGCPAVVPCATDWRVEDCLARSTVQLRADPDIPSCSRGKAEYAKLQ